MIRDGRVRAALLIGKRPVDFDEHSTRSLFRFADSAWSIVERKMAEMELQREARASVTAGV